MNFNVNPSLALPVYSQLMRQVIDGIAGGQLSPGVQLPSHRELSAQLSISPLTVKKAYDELQRAGYIEQARGSGSYVRESLPEVAAADLEAQVEDAARMLLRRASLANLDLHDVMALLEVLDDERTKNPHDGPVTRRRL